MIGQDLTNAALEGMNLFFETFSRKGRKMPRISIKVSDKNLIKVASLNGKRQHWCSYWLVPAIPNEGPFPVPAGFRFHVDKDNRLFVENEAGDHKIQLFEGDFLVLVAPSIRDQLAESSEGETRIWLSKGIFVANLKYFTRHWAPAESDDKSIPALIAKGTLIDTESKDYKGMEGLHSALAGSGIQEGSPEHNPFDHITLSITNPSKDELQLMQRILKDRGYTVTKAGEAIPFEGDVRKTFPLNESSVAVTIVDVTRPSLAEIHICEQILRQQGRAVIDTLNPSKDQLDKMAELLMSRSYLIYKKGQKGLSDLAWAQCLLRADGYHVMDHSTYVRTQDINYESGYAAASKANRRRQEIDGVLATRAYEVGFEAGRMVEKLGILNGEESHDREERESASEGDSRVGREGESRTVRWSSGRGGPSQSIRRTESRPHSATQWADSEQPQYSEPGESTGDSIHQTDGKATPQCNENEEGDA